MKNVGYKQTMDHINSSPKISEKILDLSTIGKSRYGGENKTADINVFLQRPAKYYFAVTVNGSGLISAYTHTCYFDKKEDAEKAHKELRIKLYDQVTAPFLSKIKSKQYLTQNDKDKIFNIIERFEKLKIIDD